MKNKIDLSDQVIMITGISGQLGQFLANEVLTCGICLDELQEGQDVIELPNTDKHYFHIKTSECDGIYPWLKGNNTCPMCREQVDPSFNFLEVYGNTITIPENNTN